jgi:hypothetical protein
MRRQLFGWCRLHLRAEVTRTLSASGSENVPVVDVVVRVVDARGRRRSQETPKILRALVRLEDSLPPLTLALSRAIGLLNTSAKGST